MPRNEKLIAAREARGWSQEVASEKIGMSRVHYARLEVGANTPHGSTVGLMCQAFRMSAADLGYPQFRLSGDGSSLVIERQAITPALSNSPSTGYNVQKSDMLASPSFEEREKTSSCSKEPCYPVPSSGTSGDQSSATWFSLKQQLIQLLVRQWHGRATYCDELQRTIDQELHMSDSIESLYPQETYIVSRRSMLTALALLPLTLRTSFPQQLTQPLHPEAFLPECAASITSCWHLLNGDGLTAIEQTLPAYLPTLVTWSKRPSRYQATAASLAAQGSLLMHLIFYHRFRFQDALVYADQAVELAKISGDHNLLVHTLILAGGASKWNGQPHLELQKCQEAEHLLPKTTPLLQSYALAQLADAYAQNSCIAEAQSTISKARDLFPKDASEAPYYVTTDYDLSQLILFEGQTYLTLSAKDVDQASTYYQHAKNALAAIDSLPLGVTIPQRNRVEIINYRAQAAIGIGDLDETEYYLLAGMQGAKELGSEKRRQEVVDNWQAAQQRWPQEKRVLALAEGMLTS